MYDGDDDDDDVVGYLRRPTPRQVKDKSWKMNQIRTTLHHTIQWRAGLFTYTYKTICVKPTGRPLPMAPTAEYSRRSAVYTPLPRQTSCVSNSIDLTSRLQHGRA